MEITVKLVLSASPELVALLTGLSGKAAPATETVEPAKTTRAKPVKTEETKAAENGTTEKAIDLSTIRQHVAKSEANKTAARALFPGFGIKALTELPAEKYG